MKNANMITKKPPKSIGKLVALISIICCLVVGITTTIILTTKDNPKYPTITKNIVTGENSYFFDFDDDESKGYHTISFNNMFPGDEVKQTYFFKTFQTGIQKVSFSAIFQDGFASLTNVLNVSITSSDKVLYNGPLNDLSKNFEFDVDLTEQVTEFTIIFKLINDAGNEYQGKYLKLDLNWWVDDKNYDPDMFKDVNVTECSDVCLGICPHCPVVFLVTTFALFITTITVGALLFMKNKKFNRK